jgi:Flp pilus assembly protein TadD
MAALTTRLVQASLAALLLGSLGACADGSAGRRGADFASRLRIASVAEASGQTEVAMSVLSSLASTAPDNVDVQARYARALARAGNVQEADAAASQALRRKPGDPVLLLELGRIRLLEGRAAEASEAFAAVAASRPWELGAVLGRGIAQDLLGHHPEAQANYRAVLAADPQNLPALNNLALSMVLAGDAGGAVPVLQRLATRSDAPARVRNNLSVAQAAVNEEGARGISPVAAHAPRATAGAATVSIAQPGAPHASPSQERGAVAPTGFGGGTEPAAFTDGVVAMEPIPDAPRRPKPASKAPANRAAAEGE